MPIDPALSTSERSAISAAKSAINSEIITTSANIQAIAMQKVNNSATLTTTDAQVEAAQANVNAIKTQISKTVIRALFEGQVDKNNIVVGQLVSPSVPVITISNNNLEITTNIPEINLSGVKVGGDATITLDAFGNGVIFPATIISIDSAPSIINGVSTYGAKLKFKDFDGRIKTGMTANITILSEKHSNVLIVPKSAVIQKDGLYFVIIDKGNSEKETKQVNIGLKDDKNIEIVSGLNAGEKVLAY
jgi:RND family efflux transporter MFP subunit